MKAGIRSKHAVVHKAPYMLYMAFVDMRNFTQMVPEDKRGEFRIEADYDSVHAVVQGFNVGVKVVERVPYSRIDFADDGAPFQFSVSMHFDAVDGQPDSTDFSVEVEDDAVFKDTGGSGQDGGWSGGKWTVNSESVWKMRSDLRRRQ